MTGTFYRVDQSGSGKVTVYRLATGAYALRLDAGGVRVLRPVRMAPMALSFLVPFAALVGVFAAAGRSFVAIWHTGPIAGSA